MQINNLKKSINVCWRRARVGFSAYFPFLRQNFRFIFASQSVKRPYVWDLVCRIYYLDLCMSQCFVRFYQHDFAVEGNLYRGSFTPEFMEDKTLKNHFWFGCLEFWRDRLRRNSPRYLWCFKYGRRRTIYTFFIRLLHKCFRVICLQKSSTLIYSGTSKFPSVEQLINFNIDQSIEMFLDINWVTWKE